MFVFVASASYGRRRGSSWIICAGTRLVMPNIAPRIMVYPCDAPPPAVAQGWIALPLLPRVSGAPSVFGDGSHATTRLCAAAVDVLCRQRQPDAVLDVGTGSGVLARVARARGARFIVGTDIDPAALANARAHAALDRSEVEIQCSAALPDHWGARFDLIVANILEAPLLSLARALADALRPGGVLLLSGFTRMQTPALRLAYANVGLGYLRHSDLDEWTLLTFARTERF
jgi:ribosomal protein L11 methyltransferase